MEATYTEACQRGKKELGALKEQISMGECQETNLYYGESKHNHQGKGVAFSFVWNNSIGNEEKWKDSCFRNLLEVQRTDWCGKTKKESEGRLLEWPEVNVMKTKINLELRIRGRIYKFW